MNIHFDILYIVSDDSDDNVHGDPNPGIKTSDAETLAGHCGNTDKADQVIL